MTSSRRRSLFLFLKNHLLADKAYALWIFWEENCSWQDGSLDGLRQKAYKAIGNGLLNSAQLLAVCWRNICSDNILIYYLFNHLHYCLLLFCSQDDLHRINVTLLEIVPVLLFSYLFLALMKLQRKLPFFSKRKLTLDWWLWLFWGTDSPPQGQMAAGSSFLPLMSYSIHGGRDATYLSPRFSCSSALWFLLPLVLSRKASISPPVFQGSWPPKSLGAEDPGGRLTRPVDLFMKCILLCISKATL